MSGQIYSVPFAQIPEWILDAQISDRAVRLFCVLQRYAGKDGGACPHRKTLAARLVCSTASLDRALNELRSVNAITSEHRVDHGGIVGNDYWLWPAKSSQVSSTGRTADASPSVTVDAKVASPARQQEREPMNESQLEREKRKSSDASLTVCASPDIEWLCSLLASLIDEHRGGNARPIVTKKWRDDMRLLVTRGPLGLDKPAPKHPTDIERALRLIFSELGEPEGNSTFCWAGQVQSAHALRRHWLKMSAELQLRRKKTVSAGARAVARHAARSGSTGVTPTPAELFATPAVTSIEVTTKELEK